MDCLLMIYFKNINISERKCPKFDHGQKRVLLLSQDIIHITPRNQPRNLNEVFWQVKIKYDFQVWG